MRCTLLAARVREKGCGWPWWSTLEEWAGLGKDGLGWAGVRGWEAQVAGGANSLSLPY